MNTNANVNMAFYRKEDWMRFTRLAIDKESLHDNWEEWHEAFLKTKLHMVKQGFFVNEIVIDLDKLLKYCTSNKLPNNSKTRSEFVALL